ETVATPSGDSRDTLGVGEGEKGRRGEGEKTLLPDPAPPAQAIDRFEEFWDTYAKKVGRKVAIQKYRLALRKPGVTPELLIQAASTYIASQKAANKYPEFTKDPATWLNGEHWTDEHVTPRAIGTHRPGESLWDLPATGTGR